MNAKTYSRILSYKKAKKDDFLGAICLIYRYRYVFRYFEKGFSFEERISYPIHGYLKDQTYLLLKSHPPLKKGFSYSLHQRNKELCLSSSVANHWIIIGREITEAEQNHFNRKPIVETEMKTDIPARALKRALSKMDLKGKISIAQYTGHTIITQKDRFDKNIVRTGVLKTNQ